MSNRFFIIGRRLGVAVVCGLVLCCASCRPQSGQKAEAIAEQVWTFAQAHPDGFTLDISTMSQPTEGISVSYIQTQDAHSREELTAVVTHALAHEGYVGGWLCTDDSLYYFDSNRLFPEDSIEAAIRFGRENGQQAIYILSTGTEIRL